MISPDFQFQGGKKAKIPLKIDVINNPILILSFLTDSVIKWARKIFFYICIKKNIKKRI